MCICVYFDELLGRLEGNGVGCQHGHHVLGVLSHADDNASIAHDNAAAQTMFKVCEHFAVDYSVFFICTNSVLLIFYDMGSYYDFKLKLNGCDLVLKEQACHLGMLISEQSSFDNVKKKELQICIIQQIYSCLTLAIVQ